MLDPCGIDSNSLFVFGGYRVEEADALDEPSSAPAAAVRNHYVIKGPAFGAGTGESNFDHGLKRFLFLRPYRRNCIRGQAADSMLRGGVTATRARQPIPGGMAPRIPCIMRAMPPFLRMRFIIFCI